MKVKLTRPFYDGKKRHEAGTVLDLESPPKTAIQLGDPVEAEMPEPGPKKPDPRSAEKKD
jgi:hypothetical protein